MQKKDCSVSFFRVFLNILEMSFNRGLLCNMKRVEREVFVCKNLRLHEDDVGSVLDRYEARPKPKLFGRWRLDG